MVKKKKKRNKKRKNYEKRILGEKKDTFFQKIEMYNTKRLNFQSKKTIY